MKKPSVTLSTGSRPATLLLMLLALVGLTPGLVIAQTTVSVSASDDQAAEDGLDPGTFTFTRTGATNATLRVFFTLSGTAARNSDYSLSPNTPSSVDILAGNTSATLIVTPIADNLVEGNEIVIATLRDNAAYQIDTNNQVDQITISDDPVTVSVSASDDQAAEDGLDPGTFTFTRTQDGAFNTTLRVFFTLSGTAARNSDYSLSPNTPSSVDILAGNTSATLIVTPIADNLVEGNEIVIATLRDNAAYQIDTNNQVDQITISDDPVTVSVSASDDQAAEDGLDPGTFTFTRTQDGAFNTTLRVFFTLSGTAARNSDYSLSPNTPSSVDILAGNTSATLIVTPIADNLVEGNEIVIATLRDNAAYQIDTNNQVDQITISDDPVTVSVSASDDQAAEDGLDPGTFTFTRTQDGAFNTTLRVFFTLSGTAARNSDYSLSPNTPSSVDILAGNTSATLIVTPIADTNDELPESIIATLRDNAAYLLNSAASVATITLSETSSEVFKDDFEND